jgi:hypothetical protein
VVGIPAQARFVCDHCGRDRTSSPPLTPCRCGGTARRRVDVSDSFRRPIDAPAPPWDPLKDWSTKYLQFSWNVAQLRRLYAPGSTADDVEVRRIVDMTFASCIGLADWLSAGPEPASVLPGDVERFVAIEPIAVAAALLQRREDASARTVPVGFSRPPHFWVEYRRPNARPVRYDSLDLAERCLLAWQRFLGERRVPLPVW